jgi:hypothetical protein
VFFPTVLPTHVGHLIQGPYRTTPSRDNVPPDDTWNQHLVEQTGELLLESLRWLAKRHRLDAGTLKCLLLDREKFEEGLFAPLFAESRKDQRQAPSPERSPTPTRPPLRAGRRRARSTCNRRNWRDP